MKRQVLTIEDLASCVQEARKAQGITQADLAGLTGLGRRFIIELEEGKNTAQIGKVWVVLRTLGIAMQAVTEWE